MTVKKNAFLGYFLFLAKKHCKLSNLGIDSRLFIMCSIFVQNLGSFKTKTVEILQKTPKIDFFRLF